MTTGVGAGAEAGAGAIEKGDIPHLVTFLHDIHYRIRPWGRRRGRIRLIQTNIEAAATLHITAHNLLPLLVDGYALLLLLHYKVGGVPALLVFVYVRCGSWIVCVCVDTLHFIPSHYRSPNNSKRRSRSNQER